MAGSITASGTVASPTTSYTIAKLLTKISTLMGFVEGTAASDLRVYQAITYAGQVAARWKGVNWWWLHGRGSFLPLSKMIATVANSGAVRSSNTVTMVTTAVHGLSTGRYVRVSDCDDSTINGTYEITVTNTTTFTFTSVGDDSASGNGSLYSNEYLLRSVNSAAMADLWAVERVYYDRDRALVEDSYRDLRCVEATGLDATESESMSYAVIYDGLAPLLYLSPTPNTTDRLYVDYIRFHPAISAAANDVDLLIPGPFHEGIYVQGAAWLLSNDIGEMDSLEKCPGFVAAIDRMHDARPSAYDKDDDNMFEEPGPKGLYPHNRYYTTTGDGSIIWNAPSVT